MTQILVPRRTAPLKTVGWGDFDRIFDQLWRSGPLPTNATSSTPRMDVAETDEALVVQAELPGFEEDDISVSLEDGVLTISGERTAAAENDEAGVHLREIFRGNFERSLRLPIEVDADGVSAAYRNGILVVTLPKAPAARMRNIPITGAD